jgi:hypothetical protein
MAAQAYFDHSLSESLTMDISWFSDQNKVHRPKHIFFQLQRLVDNETYFAHSTRFPKLHQFTLRKINAMSNDKLQRLKIIRDSSQVVNSITRPGLVIGDFENFKFLPKFSSIDLILQKLDSNSDWKRRMSDRIVNENPIIMHVRLGDYLTYPEIYGFIDERYYIEALEHLRSKGVFGPLWLTSDNPEYALKIFSNKIEINEVLKTPLGLEPLQLLLTLAESRNLIIAHSTFSWWSAWVSFNRNKKANIVMPSRFLAHEAEAKRLQVPGWHVVQV